jgi:hypothetical protein
MEAVTPPESLDRPKSCCRHTCVNGGIPSIPHSQGFCEELRLSSDCSNVNHFVPPKSRNPDLRGGFCSTMPPAVKCPPLITDAARGFTTQCSVPSSGESSPYCLRSRYSSRRRLLNSKLRPTLVPAERNPHGPSRRLQRRSFRHLISQL